MRKLLFLCLFIIGCSTNNSGKSGYEKMEVEPHLSKEIASLTVSDIEIYDIDIEMGGHRSRYPNFIVGKVTQDNRPQYVFYEKGDIGFVLRYVNATDVEIAEDSTQTPKTLYETKFLYAPYWYSETGREYWPAKAGQAHQAKLFIDAPRRRYGSTTRLKCLVVPPGTIIKDFKKIDLK